MAVTRSCPGTGRSPDDDTARFPLGLASAVAQPWPPVPGSPQSSTAGQTDPQKNVWVQRTRIAGRCLERSCCCVFVVGASSWSP